MNYQLWREQYAGADPHGKYGVPASTSFSTREDILADDGFARRGNFDDEKGLTNNDSGSRGTVGGEKDTTKSGSSSSQDDILSDDDAITDNGSIPEDGVISKTNKPSKDTPLPSNTTESVDPPPSRAGMENARDMARELCSLSTIIQSYPKDSKQWQVLHSLLELARQELDAVRRVAGMDDLDSKPASRSWDDEGILPRSCSSDDDASSASDSAISPPRHS